MMFFKVHMDAIRSWVKFLISIVILISLFSVSYTTFFAADQFQPYSPSYNIAGATTTGLSTSQVPAEVPTNISHIFFGVGGSANTWQTRRGYIEQWWIPGSTRGFVWFDKDPPPHTIWKKVLKKVAPSYRVSEDASRFGPRVSAARLARILSETYKLLVSNNVTDVRWIVMGDDDTLFFPQNLAAVLGKYDHREMYYVGSSSETVLQSIAHSMEMAYGGAGIAVSLPAAKEITEILDGCLLRYRRFYGSDQRIHACLIELGIPLTREPGFHQMDIRGDPYGILAAHPIAPVISLHHLEKVRFIFPDSNTQLEAVKKLIEVSHADPSRLLQQTVCYDTSKNWSVSVSWGYTVQIYTKVLPPRDLTTPLQTFQTWTGYANGPFNFDTRPLSSDPCEWPMVFFLDRIASQTSSSSSSSGNSWEKKITTTSTVYKKNVLVAKDGKKCKTIEHVEASKVETATVIAPLMDPNDWRKAPRRQCCRARRKGTKMFITIKKCTPGETSYMF